MVLKNDCLLRSSTPMQLHVPAVRAPLYEYDYELLLLASVLS